MIDFYALKQISSKILVKVVSTLEVKNTRVLQFSDFIQIDWNVLQRQFSFIYFVLYCILPLAQWNIIRPTFHYNSIFSIFIHIKPNLIIQ